MVWLQNLAKYFRRWTRAMCRVSRCAAGGNGGRICADRASLFGGTDRRTANGCFPVCAAVPANCCHASRSPVHDRAGSEPDSQSDVQNQICPNYLPSMFDCSSLIVIVQSYSTFASASTSAPQLLSTGPTRHQPWHTVRAPQAKSWSCSLFIRGQWSAVLWDLSLANLPNGAAEMMGVSAFRVEPY